MVPTHPPPSVTYHNAIANPLPPPPQVYYVIYEWLLIYPMGLLPKGFNELLLERLIKSGRFKKGAG